MEADRLAQQAVLADLDAHELLPTIDFMFPALALAESLGWMATVSAPPQASSVLAERVRRARGGGGLGVDPGGAEHLAPCSGM